MLHISRCCAVGIELVYTWTQGASLRASVGFQILIHVPKHLQLLWASDSLMLLSMLAILLSDLHNIYNFILLLFSLNSLLLCIIPFIYQARLTDLASSYDLHTSEPPVASATLILLLPSFLPCWKRTFFSDWDFGFLSFELAHSLLITIDYFWLWFILICEIYAPELNAVLYKSIYQPQKDYPYICLFFFKIFSLFWAMV